MSQQGTTVNGKSRLDEHHTKRVGILWSNGPRYIKICIKLIIINHHHTHLVQMYSQFSRP